MTHEGRMVLSSACGEGTGDNMLIISFFVKYSDNDYALMIHETDQAVMDIECMTVRHDQFGVINIYIPRHRWIRVS